MNGYIQNALEPLNNPKQFLKDSTIDSFSHAMIKSTAGAEDTIIWISSLAVATFITRVKNTKTFEDQETKDFCNAALGLNKGRDDLPDNMQDATKTKAGLPMKKHLLLSLNYQNHWSLLFIKQCPSIPKQFVYHYDSRGTNLKFSKELIHYLTLSGVLKSPFKSKNAHVPSQTGAYHCGYHVCGYVAYIVHTNQEIKKNHLNIFKCIKPKKFAIFIKKRIEFYQKIQ